MSPRAGLDKERVVRAAAELLNAEGPAALTLNRLAKRLGVQTPSLYNHVDGLPGLQYELALLNVRGLDERLEQAAIGRSGAMALRSIAQAYREYIKQSPGVYMASLQASRNWGEASPKLEAAEERVVAVVLAVVASFGLSGEDGLHVGGQGRHPREAAARQRLAGDDGLDVRVRQGGHRVDRDDPGVGQRAAQDRPVQHPRQRDVVHEGALAADEASILLARYGAVGSLFKAPGAGAHGRPARCSAAQRTARTMFS